MGNLLLKPQNGFPKVKKSKKPYGRLGKFAKIGY